MKGKGLGWVLLLGALAVPAVLFFKWWTQMKASQAVEARQAVPASAPFGGSPAAPQEAAPKAPEAAPKPAEAAPVEAAPMASEAALPRANARSAADQTAPAEPQAPAPSQQAGVPAPAAAQEPPPEAPRANAQPALLAYMPKTTRDPMLSVADLRALAQERYRKEMSQREVEKAAAEPEKAPAAPAPRPLCETLELQGIIGTGGTIMAIVNDQTVREGDKVGGAVVERLTTRTIVFRKGKKTCMKRVSK